MTAKKNPEDKLKAGARTKYKEAYCNGLIEHMKEGLSFESYAAVIGVNRDTLYHWTTLFPEFSDAKSQAQAHCLLFYEKMGVSGMKGEIKNFSAPSWIFSMKARFKWQDSHEPENENKNGKDYEEKLKSALEKLNLKA